MCVMEVSGIMPALSNRGSGEYQPSTSRLRRGELERGPFNMAQLAELWDAGHIQPTDEFRYPGMGDWRPVTEWDPASE